MRRTYRAALEVEPAAVEIDAGEATSAPTASRAKGSVVIACPPPAHPTYRQPHSSVSRLMSVLAVSSSATTSRLFAPVSPVSSSTVKRHSSGGMVMESSDESRSASAAATPIPLSAPSVVSVAFNQPPLVRKRMGSTAKSCVDDGVFCVTMSRCPWMITGGVPAAQFTPPRVITALPTASLLIVRPGRAATKARSQSITRCSCFDARGMDDSSPKYFHRFDGAPRVCASLAVMEVMLLKWEECRERAPSTQTLACLGT